MDIQKSDIFNDFEHISFQNLYYMMGFDENFFKYAKDSDILNNGDTLFYSIATVNAEFYVRTLINALEAGVKYFLVADKWTEQFVEYSAYFLANVPFHTIYGAKLCGSTPSSLAICFFKIVQSTIREELLE
jgi:hypothetical protein